MIKVYDGAKRRDLEILRVRGFGFKFKAGIFMNVYGQ